MVIPCRRSLQLGEILDRHRAHFSISDVVAVRGQRSAAFVIRVDYGDDTYSENLSCFQLDSTLTLMHRFVAFDKDAVDTAIAELDRLHVEISD